MTEHRRVDLTPEQQALVSQAHQRWKDDQQLVRRSKAALDGICSVLAGPDFNLREGPDGLTLYSTVEETDGT